MTTRINVNSPPLVLEAANATQAANRNRLEERENRMRVEKNAARLIKIEEAKIQNRPKKKGKNDPWKGAIPEYETQLVLPKRRPLTEFGIIIQEDLLIRTIRYFGIETFWWIALTGAEVKQILKSSNLITTPSVKRSKLSAFRHLSNFAFEGSSLRSPTFSLQSLQLMPTDYGTYPRSMIKSTGDGNTYTSILRSSKDSILFKVQGELNKISFAEGSLSDILEVQVGVMIPLDNLSRSSYVYVYGVGYSVENCEHHFSSIHPTPDDEILARPDYDANYVVRIRFTPERKQLLAKEAKENNLVFHGALNPDGRVNYRKRSDITIFSNNTYTEVLVEDFVDNRSEIPPYGLMGHAYLRLFIYENPVDRIYQLIYTDKNIGYEY